MSPATFLKQCAKILFIGFFALNVDGYHNQVVTAFNGFESGLSDALNANAAGPAASIYETLDGVLEKGGLLAAEAMRQASDAGWNIGAALGWFMTGIFVSIGTLVFAVIGGANIIVAKFSLAIMFALGPLFIMCAMFPMTARFFDNWVGQVLNYIFTIVILALIMTFGVVAFDGFISGVKLEGAGIENPYIIGLQVFGLTLVLSYIALQASSMASGLAGGVSTSALSLRQIALGAAMPGRAIAGAHNVVNPVSNRLDPRTGHQTQSRRLEHMAMGRTLINPAYRQSLRDRMERGWGDAEGGGVKKG